MRPGANVAEVARFRAVLAERLGWTFGEDDMPQLARVLARRAERLRVGRTAYLGQLAAGGESAEPAALAEELTITETYFYRHAEQFRALAEVVLPELLQARAAARRLRLLSVGCSSGEEAYTLAIAAREVRPDRSWDITVLGVDANPAVLRRAVAGRYSSWSLRDTPESVRQRWLLPRDDEFEVDPELRAGVQFQQHNVVEDDILWRGGGQDVIFCRNLLMYLTPAARALLVQRMTRALAPGGHLFLGHTDTLGRSPEGLESVHSHHTFYYRRGVDAPPPQPVGPPDTGPQIRDARPAPRPVGSAPRPVGSAPPSREGESGAVRRRALSLLRGERFAEALTVVEAGLPDRPSAADLLLHGVLLAQAGRLDAAEIVARQALDADGLCADAHHLLGVCLEDGAAVEVAIGQYRLAAHLDPQFAMPRLRQGLLARRRGDHHTVQTHLESASALLWHEAQERIALFGGGFGRTSLLTLCRTELDACGVHR